LKIESARAGRTRRRLSSLRSTVALSSALNGLGGLFWPSGRESALKTRNES
jgi:hypothetical protein